MGFTVDVANRLVTVDHSHNNYSVTTPAGNPTHLILPNGLKVTSIFSRTKGKRAKRGGNVPPGDNSPMLYALKGMHQLQTTRRSVMDLNLSYRQILPVFVAAGFQWDWLLPLPSSSNLTALFANRVCTDSGVGFCHHGAMVKISAQQVLKNLQALKIKASDRSAIREDVNRFIKKNSPQTAFQIKAITRTHLRPHINPLMWGHLPAVVPPRRVLLIDDMVTTGTSLVCANDILKNRYPTVQIEALTLFGSTK
ncbi:phosphoribosyltransferase [Serratia fonticola]